MLEKYRQHVLPNPEIALIHASCDEVSEDAVKWAYKVGFTWPTVLWPDWEAVGLGAYGAFAGEIFLVDSNGTLVAENEDEAFARIAELK
ncbi:MAG: hypothetical protein HRU37_01850 [Roseibacillus sp.]|nr:hypothetical protein [Roseibacillus sp.]